MRMLSKDSVCVRERFCYLRATCVLFVSYVMHI